MKQPSSSSMFLSNISITNILISLRQDTTRQYDGQQTSQAASRTADDNSNPFSHISLFFVAIVVTAVVV